MGLKKLALIVEKHLIR